MAAVIKALGIFGLSLVLGTLSGAPAMSAYGPATDSQAVKSASPEGTLQVAARSKRKKAKSTSPKADTPESNQLGAPPPRMPK